MGTPEVAAAVSEASLDHLRKDLAGDTHWPALPSDDPIAAQVAACEAVSRFLRIDALDARQLDLLLTLDRHARRIGSRLLRRYVEGDAQLQLFHRRDWSAALRLSQSFHGAYQHFWRHIRGAADDSWIPHAHRVLFHMFHHRQVELLLRFMRYKKRIADHWEEMHEIYKFALKNGIARLDVDAGRAQHKPAKATTLEHRYIRLLLLDLLNNGQFSPREGLWADALLSRWCRFLRLQSRKEKGAVQVTQAGFVVDLDGTDGLRRAIPSTAENALFLDTSPLMDLIAEELESRGTPDSRLGELAFATRAGQVALLKKIAVIVGPTAVRIKRRGERRSIAVAAEGIAGIADIVQILREEARTEPRVAEVEGITISPLGAERYSSSFASAIDLDPGSAPGADKRVVVPRAWQMKDCSDSGCRMRGQIEDLNQLIAGALIATRESAQSPWTVSVVRRFRRLMVDYVEIGVEYLGRRPRFVKLVAGGAVVPAVEALSDPNIRCFAALYLPPSEGQPTMPVKTLLLPARHFRAECTVTLLSSNANYTLRLNEPIRQQFEFVCVPFTVLHKQGFNPHAR